MSDNKPYRKKRQQSKYLKVTMPTKTYLKKFIQFYEGEMPVIDNSSHFKAYVFAMLGFGTVRDKEYKPKNLSEMGHADTLTMLVSYRTFSHIGHTITMEKAMYINRLISYEFSSRLAMAVMNLHIRKGMTLNAALEYFCVTHGIEIDKDITLDNLVKTWQRRLHKIEPACVCNTVAENLIIPFETSKQLGLF